LTKSVKGRDRRNFVITDASSKKKKLAEEILEEGKTLTNKGEIILFENYGLLSLG